jgi:hypothetical protein
MEPSEAPRHPPARVRGSDIVDWLERTRATRADTRRVAVRALCPCHVRADRDAVWDRLLEMTDDQDRKVRSHVIHALTDGSPRDRERDVIGALKRMQFDPDPGLRRRARRILAVYRRTGAWNVG